MVLLAQISDLHLRPRGVAAYRVVETNMLAERAVAAIEALRPAPDAVIVTGDIAYDGLEAEYRVARDILSRLSMPFFVIPGNHDNPARMKAGFADQDWARGGPPDRLYYAADIGPFRLVALDSSVPGAAHGELAAEQLDFLNIELAAAAGRPALVAVHHPPFRCGLLGMDSINLRDPGRLEAVISGHRNVAAILAGHHHRTIFARFAGTAVIVPPSTAHQVALDLERAGDHALNLEPAAYFLHRWTEADGLTSHLAYVERYPGPFPFSAEPGYEAGFGS